MHRLHTLDSQGRLPQTAKDDLAGDLVAALPTPYYIAHRGGANVVPEQSPEGFRIMDATGIDVLEADVQPTADGALVCLHDSTVDRTTDGTGPVSGYSLPAFLSLDAAAQIPWPRVSPPSTLQQFLSEFGHRRVLMLEPKDTTTLTKMLDACDAAGVKRNIMVETATLSVAQAAVARGYQVWFYWGATITSPTVSSVLAAGVQHLAAAVSISDADMRTLVATGRPVTVYGVNRRYDRDRFLALGAKAISSDNPTYVKSTTALQTRDSWARGVWGHGLTSNRAAMPGIENGALVLSLTNNAWEIVTPGEVCPITKTTYSIDIDLGWKSLPSDLTRALQVQFGVPDDQAYNFASTTASHGFPNGYNVHLRANGQLQLYKLTAYNSATSTAGASTLMSGMTVETGALTAGQLAHLKIDVTPTGFTVTRTDTGHSLTTTDASFRGGYLMLVRYSQADGAGLFKNLIVT